jgi:ferredoxin--NADP+ reductase
MADHVYEMWVRAPHVACHTKEGQFLITRIDEHGEHIHLTISAVDRDSIRVVFLAEGKTTFQLASLRTGDHIKDVAGPLEKPGVIRHYETCVLVGGGIGAGSKSIERVIPQYYSTEVATWERST